MNEILCHYLLAGVFYTLGAMSEWLHLYGRQMWFWRGVGSRVAFWPYYVWTTFTP